MTCLPVQDQQIRIQIEKQTVSQMKAEIAGRVRIKCNMVSLNFIAEVNENGLVTVKEKNGEVKITAVSKADTTKSGEVTLKVALKQENANRTNEDAVQENGKWKPNPSITWSEGWTTWDGEADRHHGGTKTEATGAGK